MEPVSDEMSAFIFRMWRREWGDEGWSHAPRMLIRLSEADRVLPARLSWTTRDGVRSTLGFAPDMASCYGHRQDGDGRVLELMGELADWDAPGGEVAHGYEFATETTEIDAGPTDPGNSTGRLRILIDDGDRTELATAEWSTESGDTSSITLVSRDVGDLVAGVTASAEHRAAGEVAANLLRASDEKWFAPRRRATLEFRMTAPTTVDQYVLTSANDAPDRDPSAWTLRGSLDGQRWHTLDIRSDRSFTDRHQSRTYRIAEPVPYTHYRLDITGNHGSPDLQLRDVRFLADDGFAGFRRPAGLAPLTYRGTVAARASAVAPQSGDPKAPRPDQPSAQADVAATAFSEYIAPSAARSATVPLKAAEVHQQKLTNEQMRVELTPMVAAEFRPMMQAQVSRAVPAREALQTRQVAAHEVGPDTSRWQYGGSWLPLGGSLSMQSLTSPSGRFTALHSPYEPSFAVRDNSTRERVWISDSPGSHLLCLGPDGDLVGWDHHGNHMWSTGTAWLGVQRLELRDSGELALVDTEGETVWSTGIPDVPADAESRPVPRGARLRRGESLCGQSLTSDDGSTVLFHDGRVVRIIMNGQTSHWDVFPDTENALTLDDDGFLRMRDANGTVLQQISGPGVELVVERGGAELLDENGALVWASSPRAHRPAPIREPALAQDDTLTAWFTTLLGDAYAVSVARDTTPEEALGKLGVTPGLGTWTELRRYRDAMNPAGGAIVAALAVGSHVLLMTDDPHLRTKAPAAWVATVRQSGCDLAEFTVQQDGEVVTEIREFPRRRRGTRIPEVATALHELVHDLHRHTLLFRTAGIVPDAVALSGELLGGVLQPKARSTSTTEPLLVIEGWESMTPLVIRTDFTDDDAWNRLLEQMRTPWIDNDPVDPHPVTDPRLAGATTEQVLREVCDALPQPETPGAIFIADAITMREPELPLLAVTTEWDGLPFEEEDEEFITQFRLVPDAAIEISTNLDLANMDFEDFAEEGVYERMT
ncbi:DUF6924 domain-containing protein [Nocardia macrotermitis]|uniref:Bulb-type lectin domain-containing protein n=1 Tax=Nocardia macrotermitis TaxID=2585198 RepID=A0A7K0D7R0_9NOCA|nr:hypothetical protein [Nocardia macrotermitis]MQY21609.1 hypothetical protein [Nocardia macrotermitis]